MQDKFSQELEVGDTILFAKGAQSDDNLYIGTIKNILHESERIHIKCHTSNSINKRLGMDVVKLNFFKEQYPEYFI